MKYSQFKIESLEKNIQICRIIYQALSWLGMPMVIALWGIVSASQKIGCKGNKGSTKVYSATWLTIHYIK